MNTMLGILRSLTRESRRASKINSGRSTPLRVESLEHRHLLATLAVPATYATIQDAVTAAAATPEADTVEVAAGTYSTPIDIQGISGLTIQGAGAGETIFKPTTSLPWNVASYGASRRTGVRVVNSTDVRIEGMTMDFGLITGNNRFGMLYWNSTGAIHDNAIENLSLPDASGYYNEIAAYLRAVSPAYSESNRAEIVISNNTFTNAGRVGVVTHGFVDATIDGNTFGKTINDFGYAIELGSESIGEITNNTIFGYDTAALSDGSNSAGIYIENSFTSALATPLAKTVTVSGNEVYDSQWALYVGNEFNGFAGNVDLQLAATDNYFHDNLEGGVVLVDEDASAGSSVTAASRTTDWRITVASAISSTRGAMATSACRSWAIRFPATTTACT